MKKQILFFLCCVTFLFACEEEVTKMKDEISYRKYAEFKVLNPADSVGYISNLQCQKAFPYPSDSVVSVEVDMDLDGENDFQFSYTTAFNAISTTDSCKNYSSKIEVKALGIGNNVMVDKIQTDRIQIFQEEEKIPRQSKLSGSAYLFLDDSAPTVNNIDLEAGNQYMGIQLMEGGKGWIKFYYTADSIRLTLMEQAYNHNIHFDIKAGQKK